MTPHSNRRSISPMNIFRGDVAFMQFSGYSCQMDLSEAEHDESKNGWSPVPARINGVLLTKQQAQTGALVLSSRSIPCRIESAGGEWHLLVPEQHLESACRELKLYEEANRNWPPPLPATRQLVENTLPTVSVLLLLAILHNLSLIGFSLPERGLLDLHNIGAAHAADIRSGLWWQCITALTLHADLTHLLSNLTIGGVIIILLCRELGSGLAWSLLLASGTAGNLLNAWVQSPAHRSVGASTAVFGAVGILAAVSMLRDRHLRRRWFVPFAAGVALLAILGTEGKNTDLGAHLFGFCAGLLFGAGTELLVAKYGRPDALLNFLLALLSGVVVACAWWAAIEIGG